MKPSLSLTFSSVGPATLFREPYQRRTSVQLSNRNAAAVLPLCRCQTDRHSLNNIPSLLTRGGALMEEQNSVVSPNGHQHDEGIGILKFLSHKAFLITGATGFLGKVLIEKILRTAPDVHKIFVLIKLQTKKQLQRDSRMRQLFAISKSLFFKCCSESTNIPSLFHCQIIHTQLFEAPKQIHGNSFQAFIIKKLVPVVGNICETSLGLDEDDAVSIAKERQGKILENPFSIHEDELQFGNHHERLSVEGEIKLVHDSKQVFEDNSLPQKMKELGKQRANKFGWQDTYVFTKAMGEMMIDCLRGNMPVVIIWPSVVESTYKEPFPRRMEGNRMMDPIILHYGKGQLTGFLADPNGVLDVVPADMVVNAILAATAKHGEAGKPETSIYQVASSVISHHQEGTIRDVGRWDVDGQWIWSEAGWETTIREGSRTQAYIFLLTNKLSALSGVGVGEDSLVWGETNGDKYSVKSGKEKLAETEIQTISWVRGKEVTLKVNIFLWRMLKYRRPTYENLWSRDAVSEHFCCTFCQHNVEDGWHAVYHCPKTRRAMTTIFEWWHIGFVEAESLSTLLWNMFDIGQTQIWSCYQRTGWECTVMAACWCIWKHRNSMIFSDKKTSVLDDTKICSYEWIKNRMGLKKLTWVDWFREPALALENAI